MNKRNRIKRDEYLGGTARKQEHEYIPLRSPEFDIDENVLRVGAAYFDRVVRDAITEYAGDKK